MESGTLSEEETVKYLNERFVNVKVDVDADKKTAGAFKVRAIPDTRILTADGTELLKVLGNRPEFLQQVKALEEVAKVEKALADNPNSAGTMIDASDVYLRLGRLEDAAKILEKALGADPDDREGRRAEAWYKLGVANARGGRSEQAEAAWAELARLDPKDEKKLYHHVQFARCQQAIDDEDYAKASTGLEQFLQRYPQSEHVPEAQYLLGVAQFQGQEYEKALSTFRDVERSHPGTPAAKKAAEAAKKADKKLKK
jgi:tetratricopeptide (TPR) repeat protein